MKNSYFYLMNLFLLCGLLPVCSVVAQANPQKTKVAILGVGHSTQLIAESYQPAALRAFIERVKPDAICIERSPEEFARNDFYEFTYEQQYLTVPLARERKISLYPIDWLPSSDDTLLAFNIADLEKPPFIRNPVGFQGFINFPEKSDLDTPLFYAESETARNQQKQFAEVIPSNARFDYARRLYLYRTFMQAMRIVKAANDNRGKTVLIIIGSLHKNDIEQILKSEQSIEIVQPSSFGSPAPASIAAAIKREDLFAIAIFNLLGTQSKTGNVNWDWMNRILAQIEKPEATAETILLKTRFQVLTDQVTAETARSRYEKAFEMAKPENQFTWTGVKDRSRLDSYFDPFGNLPVRQRLQIEIARENSKLKQLLSVSETQKQMISQLSPLKAQQLAAYWDEYIINLSC